MISAPKIYVAGHRGMVGSAIVRTMLSVPCRSGAPAAMPSDPVPTILTHAEPSKAMSDTAGCQGQTPFDAPQPDDVPRKFMVSRRVTVLGCQAFKQSETIAARASLPQGPSESSSLSLWESRSRDDCPPAAPTNKKAKK